MRFNLSFLFLLIGVRVGAIHASSVNQPRTSNGRFLQLAAQRAQLASASARASANATESHSSAYEPVRTLTATKPPGDFCWIDTQVHPTSGIPNVCPSGEQKLGGFCYDNCSGGSHIVGLNCVADTCAPGYTKGPSGLDCWYSFSSRWVGWGGDCDGDHPTHIGCCICDNSGLETQGLSYSLIGSIPNQRGAPGCSQGQNNFLGLCYTPCPAGMSMISAGLCTSQCPSGWVSCGAGACASDAAQCALAITDQVTSIVNVAAFFVSLGSEGVANEAEGAIKAGTKEAVEAANAIKSAEQSGLLSRLEQQLGGAKDKVEGLKKALETAIVLDRLKKGQANRNPSPTEITNEVLDAISLVDPTGIAAMVNSFVHPQCGSL